MKAIEIYREIINKENDITASNVVSKKANLIRNFINTIIRKTTTQNQRLLALKYKYINKIPYFSTKFSLDYLEYIIKYNPDMPYSFFPKRDKSEIEYFLKVMLKGAFSDGYYLSDFGGRWNKFEKVRKTVGADLKFDLLKNQYMLYGFKSVVYPDTGIFPDNYKLSLLKNNNYEVCIDVGAYIGDSAYIINKELKPNKIYAFEPEPDNFRILSENIAINSLENVIEPINLATGDSEGVMVIDSLNASSSIKSAGKGQKVDVVTIDRFVDMKKIKKVDLIKMDIEGAEMDTLQGAKQVIKKYKPDLVIAIYHKGQHFFEIPTMLRKLVPRYKFRFVALSGSSPVIERFIIASVRKVNK